MLSQPEGPTIHDEQDVRGGHSGQKARPVDARVLRTLACGGIRGAGRRLSERDVGSQDKDKQDQPDQPKPDEKEQPKPEPKSQNQQSQDDAILDQLEQAPSVQQQDAKNRALRARHGSGMEDK